MKQFVTGLLLIFFATTGFTQPLTEGKIVYEISYPDANLDAQTISMLPTEATMYFKNDKTRMELKMGMGMNMIALADAKLKTSTVLMDIMGNKTATTMSDEEFNKEAKKKGEYEITTTAETKTIAGLACKKAIVTLKDKNSFNVWYTDGIKVKNSNWNNQFKDIDGFLMEFRMDQTLGISMEMTAKSIADEKEPDNLFTIPEGYKTVNSSEMMKMYGGNGNK